MLAGIPSCGAGTGGDGTGTVAAPAKLCKIEAKSGFCAGTGFVYVVCAGPSNELKIAVTSGFVTGAGGATCPPCLTPATPP